MIAHSLEEVLEKHEFLSGLEPAHIQTLVSCASNERFKAGQYLAREGEPADSFYLVREGKIAIQTFRPHRGPLTVDTVEPGEILGYSWLIAPYRWHFDAVALESGRVIALDGSCLRRKCETDHDLGYQLLKRFSSLMERRLSTTRMQLLDLYGVAP